MHVREIDALLGAGLSFDDIEAHIEGMAIAEDAKSALWLYLWVETDRPARQQAVREVLAGITG